MWHPGPTPDPILGLLPALSPVSAQETQHRKVCWHFPSLQASPLVCPIHLPRVPGPWGPPSPTRLLKYLYEAALILKKMKLSPVSRKLTRSLDTDSSNRCE